MTVYLNYSRARSIAETWWGTGGTSSQKTNRKGVFYFSCSSHGGYVVDKNALTSNEFSVVFPYVELHNVWVNLKADGTVRQFQNPLSVRTRRFRIYNGDILIKDHGIMLFEEDCDWSILEALTDIRRFPIFTNPEHATSYEATRKATAIQTFNCWYSNKQAA